MKKEGEKEDNTCSVAPLHSTIGWVQSEQAQKEQSTDGI